jgi:DNA ligase D-like protein (predicted polymerase)
MKTSWKVAGRLEWLWAFATPSTVVYAIQPGREFPQAAAGARCRFDGPSFAMAARRIVSLIKRPIKPAWRSRDLATDYPRPTCASDVHALLQQSLAVRDRRNVGDISPHGATVVYLRHSKAWGPSVLRRVQIPEQKTIGEYLVVDSIEAIVTLAQIDVLEIHGWNSTTDDVERPNRIVWDLDPGPAVTWPQIRDAALVLRDMLRALELRAWVKTTGGEGLHVVMPLEPLRLWSECLEFARHVADALVRTQPKRYTTRFAKSGRERQILVDYLRNNRTNTSIAAFSTRAREGASVSMPIDWRELQTSRRPQFNLPRVLEMMEPRWSDPWGTYWTTRQALSAGAMEAVASI